MRRDIFRILSRIPLFLLFSIPTFVPALHEITHYHQHHHCAPSASDVHLHGDVFDCDLCDYLATLTWLVNLDADPIWTAEPASQDYLFGHPSRELAQLVYTDLRGPPAR